MKLSKEARELRNKYHREWRKKNSDKVRKNQAAYWERRAKELEKQENKEA